MNIQNFSLFFFGFQHFHEIFLFRGFRRSLAPSLQIQNLIKTSKHFENSKSIIEIRQIFQRFYHLLRRFKIYSNILILLPKSSMNPKYFSILRRSPKNFRKTTESSVNFANFEDTLKMSSKRLEHFSEVLKNSGTVLLVHEFFRKPEKCSRG